jgi:hypothetical protein
MRVPRDIMGRDLKEGDFINLSIFTVFDDEEKFREGEVHYDAEEDQFYLGEIPLEIYDKFIIIERNGR